MSNAQVSYPALARHEEPIIGRYYGIYCVEGDDATPPALFQMRAAAEAELQRRQSLPDEDDDWLSDDYQVGEYDVEGVFWNHVNENPNPPPTDSRIHIMNLEIERLTARLAKAPPVPMLLWCPNGHRHIDEGEFATKEHHTHACQECGIVWRPALVPTVGVRFLPGFKNEVAT